MTILDSTSLVKTLDNYNETLLYGLRIEQDTELEAARWIVAQQGKKGAYRGMFAPTSSDFKDGIRTFTGERLEAASARHITGQEAARAAWLMGRLDTEIEQAYDKATQWMRDEPDFLSSGTFCCGKCTLAFWRHYWVGDFNDKESQLVKGVQSMKHHRLGDGTWRRFPFFYAIYTLLELDIEPALAELAYARPALERYTRIQRQGEYQKRKAIICERALEKLN